jgi:hypothetical protein
MEITFVLGFVVVVIDCYFWFCFAGKWDPERVDILTVFANNFLTIWKLLDEEENQVTGVHMLMDLSEVGWQQAKNISPFFAKKVATMIQVCGSTFYQLFLYR